MDSRSLRDNPDFYDRRRPRLRPDRIIEKRAKWQDYLDPEEDPGLLDDLSPFDDDAVLDEADVEGDGQDPAPRDREGADLVREDGMIGGRGGKSAEDGKARLKGLKRAGGGGRG